MQIIENKERSKKTSPTAPYSTTILHIFSSALFNFIVIHTANQSTSQVLQEKEDPERKVRRRNVLARELVAVPSYCNFVSRKWKKSYKFPYQQHSCMEPGCQIRIRTVCVCSMDFWWYTGCFAKHSIEVSTAGTASD